tara:strand:+ start:27 stop:293 length:267 start_codon:yes stop_codon:yes gene_type:complete
MNNNIIDFPSPINLKKKKYVKIRDEIERILTAYALEKDDLWAVALASGRFASMTLEKIEGSDKAIEFFKNCIDTQEKSSLTSNSADIS